MSNNIGAEISTYLPEIAKRIIEEAENSYEGKIILPGTGCQYHFVGSPIKWTENPTTDKEYIYHLNRMEMLTNMAKAFSITNDERYAKKAIDELENWIDQVRPPQIDLSDISIFSECTPWRALEVGIRGIDVWPIFEKCLSSSKYYSQEFRKKLLSSALEHMKILKTISPLLWPKANHNHCLIENIGLLSFAVTFPELDKDGSYKAHAIKELDRCMEAQVTPEGGQIEGSPSYHNACLYKFCQRVLIDKNTPKEFIKKLDRMYEHSLHCTRNTGGCFPLGDSHADEKESIALASVSMYMIKGDWQYLAKARHFCKREEIETEIIDNLFMFKDIKKLKEDLERACHEQIKIDLPTFTFQKTLGEVFVRNGWERDDTSIAIICKSPVQNRHSHIDPGSFHMTAFGKEMIVDPGIYTYKEGADRYNFKSTRWHSTVMINQKDGWEYQGSFKYGSQKRSYIDFAQDRGTYSVASMKTECYEPVGINRTMAFFDNKLLIIDDIENLDNDFVDISFNINSVNVERYKEYAITHDEGANVKIYTSGSEIVAECGAFSLKNDLATRTTVIRFRHYGNEKRYVHASLVVPFKDVNPEASGLALMDNKDGTYTVNAGNKQFTYTKGDIYA